MKQFTLIIFFVLFFLNQNSKAQFSDNFEDSDLVGWLNTTDWVNSTDNAISGNNSLKHGLSDVAGTSYLSHSLASLDLSSNTVIWRFNLKNGSWDPSSTNAFWFYLTANEENLSSATVDGYAIGVDFTGTTDLLTLWSVTDGAVNQELIASLLDWNSSTLAGIEVVRTPLGEWKLNIDNNGGFDALVNVGNATNTDYIFTDYCGLVFTYTSTRAGLLWLDDISVSYPLDSDSQISVGVSPEPTSISSTQNGAMSPFQVLDFTFTDAGSGDGLPSIINQLTITKGANNAIADWGSIIEGAKLFGPDIAADGISGTVSADNIVFASASMISIDEAESETYQLKIYLKTDLSSINDNDALDFELLSNGVTTDALGSSFGASSVASGDILVSVIASELRFQSVSSSTYTSKDFSASIAAVDVNGNIDTDFSSQVTLSVNTGTGNLSAVSGLSKNSSSGLTNWSDLQYNTEEPFSILASTTGLANNTVSSLNIAATTATSELIDDFEDGDLAGWLNTTDWANSTESPVSGSHSLKHNLSGIAGTSYIAHNLAALSLNSGSVIWRFNIRNGDWDPSSTNAMWFYLLANEENLTSATIDGYAVGVDFTGSDDLLTLWKITDGAAAQALITSSMDWNNSTLAGIEVIRTVAGDWTLNIDKNGGFDALVNEGNSTNTDYIFTDYCGLVFKYTDTRAGLLWLDDVAIGPDKNAPQLSKITVYSTTNLILSFSEQIDQSVAETIENYNATGIGLPATATLSTDKTSVELIFATEFIDNQTYSITVANIEDISGNVMPDTTLEFAYIPFTVQQIFIPNKNELLLDFSRPLEKYSAEILTNYLVDNSIGNPTSAALINDTLVSLTFADFTPNTNYSINVANINDKNGITITSTDISFVYYPGNEFDIVVNELMVDVSPAPTVLPAAKYIEIYNRSSVDIDLSGWTFQISDNSPRSFGNIILQAKDYLILCSSELVSEFAVHGNVLGVMSESQLSTTGKTISLFNSEWQLIDYVNYTVDWYSDDSKEDGGWSLERIDADNFCGGANNWKASTDFKGGTPGKINSVSALNADVSLPALVSLQVLSSRKLALSFSKNISDTTALNLENYQLDAGTNLPVLVQFSDTSRGSVIIEFTDQFIDSQQQTIQIKNLSDFCGNIIKDTLASFIYYLIFPKSAYADAANYLRINFSEEVDVVSAQNPLNYVVDNGIGSPSTAYKHTENRNEVYLEFPGEFANTQNYKITIENVKDLDGNIMKSAELHFIYFIPSYNNLVINEILFNPKSGGVDFVEIYNKSNWPVDLSKMSLATRDENGEIASIKSLSESNLLFETGHFLAITSDTVKTKSDYPAVSYDWFVQIPTLPSYNDDKGIVVLMHNDSVTDEFSYNQDMHFALISDDEGVSLERIDPEKPTNDKDNWHSAAESYGFATPANKNSQFRQLSEGIESEIAIAPETFSPNNDGYDDVVFIRYKFTEPGYVANVSIYDGKGNIVKRIANNELLAAEGEFSWDGLHEDNTKARIGIYVIYFEVFNLQGVVKKTKKTCVLAARLN